MWCRSMYVTMHFIAVSFLLLDYSKLFYLIHFFRNEFVYKSISNVPEGIFTYNSSELGQNDFISLNKWRTLCATFSTTLTKCWIILVSQLMFLLYES